MAIKITPGYLRPEGPGMKPNRDLKRFVETTIIGNIPKDAYTDSGDGLEILVSATEAPATDVRIRGTMWFARGEGRLYRWDSAYMSSDVTTSSLTTLKSCADATPPGFWLAMSDRKEIVAMYSGRQLAGGVTRSDTHYDFIYGPLAPLNEMSHYSNCAGVHRPLIALGNRVDGRYCKIYVPTTDEFGSGYASGANNIFKVVDIGYTPIAVGSGSSGPSFGGVQSGTSDGQNFRFTSIDDPYNVGKHVYTAHITESGPVPADGLMQAFLYPNCRRVAWGVALGG